MTFVENIKRQTGGDDFFYGRSLLRTLLNYQASLEEFTSVLGFLTNNSLSVDNVDNNYYGTWKRV